MVDLRTTIIIFLSVCLWWLPLSSSAQSASTAWYLGNGAVLDFSTDSVRVRTLANVPALAGATTYTDQSGQVILSVTTTGIYSHTGQLLAGGRFAQIIPYPERTLIVPAPGSDHRYYIFYLTIRVGNGSGAYYAAPLCYALVDLAGNNGAGTVISIDQLLCADLHGSFTVAARCGDDAFWLVNEANTNQLSPASTDQIQAFRVTTAGIASKPVISVPVSIGNSSSYRFSPASDWLAFNYGGNGESAFALARFDQSTGVVSRPLKLAEPYWAAEFSASGHLLYLAKPDTVLQFDLRSGNEAQIRASRTVLYAGTEPFRTIQLAPDGRIYLLPDGSPNQLGIIAFPERAGLNAGFTPAGLKLPQPVAFLPSVATHLLYAPPVAANAGPDLVACEGQAVQLRGAPSPYPLTWTPSTYLSAPDVATPMFRYTGPPLADTLRLTYTLAFSDGTCNRRDVMHVTVLPTPVAAIIAGSTSVCPGVTGVEYQVLARPNYTYQWVVSGGTLTSGQGTANAQVNWGPTNAAAYVQVVAVNASCSSTPVRLPVRVNAALQTQMPQGPTRVCVGQAQGVAYEVGATTGSVYIWAVQGGRVASGQGTSRITVDWQGPGRHFLSLQEKSTTVDTICYGTSPTLAVTVFQDSTRGNLVAASIMPDSDMVCTLTWSFAPTQPNSRSLQLWRRVAGATMWQLLVELPSTARTYRDATVAADDASYEYRLHAYNSCDEPLDIPLHRTVRLVSSVTSPDSIQLVWNAYSGWPAGVREYEIWRRLDNEPGFTRLRQVSGTTLQVRDLASGAGLVHQYRIQALTVGAAAWSNTVDLSFTHRLLIPNVFTPNGDGHNDTFFIPNLNLYPVNSLRIYNRWGQQVYKQQGYQGNWSGADLSVGTYYYLLTIDNLHQTFKGWVELIR
jgi:gliding motility-associated-like protein